MCPPGDELKAIALHPSGFHLVVAIGDNIKFFNILSETIAEYPPSFQLKSCQEIKFSHGGHLFACAVGQSAIHIFNFYTAECPQNMKCSGHVSKVRSIDWFEDDDGFASCGMDGNAFFYDL
jgi:WD40 repeat protein